MDGLPAVTRFANYAFNTDYAWLARLAREDSIICVVDYVGVDRDHLCRDVAKTIWYMHGGEEVFQVSSRGYGYIYATGEADFIAQCKKAHLEFVEPM